MAQFLKFETPIGLQRNGTTTLPIITGPYYRHLELIMTHSTSATGTPVPTTAAVFSRMVKEIRVKLGGNTIQQISGSALIRMNAYLNAAGFTGIFPIHFARLWMLTEGGQDSSRLASFGALNAHLEIDWHESNEYPRSLDVRGQQENRLAPNDIGGYRAITKFSGDYSGVGQQEVTDLPRGPHFTHLIMIDHANQAVINGINRVQLIVNGSVQYDALPLNRKLASKRLGRVEQTGAAFIDFADKKLFGEALPMDANDLRLVIDWDVAPQTYDIYLDQTRAEQLTLR